MFIFTNARQARQSGIIMVMFAFITMLIAALCCGGGDANAAPQSPFTTTVHGNTAACGPQDMAHRVMCAAGRVDRANGQHPVAPIELVQAGQIGRVDLTKPSHPDAAWAGSMDYLSGHIRLGILATEGSNIPFLQAARLTPVQLTFVVAHENTHYLDDLAFKARGQRMTDLASNPAKVRELEKHADIVGACLTARSFGQGALGAVLQLVRRTPDSAEGTHNTGTQRALYAQQGFRRAAAGLQCHYALAG